MFIQDLVRPPSRVDPGADFRAYRRTYTLSQLYTTALSLVPRVCRSACLFLALATASTVNAQAQEPERSWSLGIAMGAGERSNPLISSDNIPIHAVIDFSWYGKHWFFDNGDLGYTLVQNHKLSVNLLGTINNERRYYSFLTGKQLGLDSLINKGLDLGGGILGSTSVAGGVTDTTGMSDDRNPPLSDKDETPVFAPPQNSPSSAQLLARNRDTALADRNTAFNGGVELLYISPYGDLQAQLLTDLSQTHDGQEAWLSWSKPWYTRHGEYTLTFGLEWKSQNLLGYYYGVTAAESFAGRPAYEGAAGTNRFIRLAARHAFSRHWQLVAMVEREFLSQAIRQSPIVSDARIDTFFTGIFYQF